MDQFDKVTIAGMISLITLLSYATFTSLNIDTKDNVYKILTNTRSPNYEQVIQIK